MRVVIAIVLALAAGSSWAADGDGTLNASVLTFTLGRWIDDGADSVDVYHAGGSTSRLVARLSAGGCIRGPFEVLDAEEHPMFSVDAGKYYPVDCGK